MTACERCWNAAYLRARTRGGFQADHYRDLLVENEAEHTTDQTEENRPMTYTGDAEDIAFHEQGLKAADDE